MSKQKYISTHLAAIVLFVIAVAPPAVAAKISEPEKGVTLTYNDTLREVSPGDQDTALYCLSSVCGGECTMMLTMKEPSLTSRDFFERFRGEINTNQLVSSSRSGLDPIVIDKPTIINIGRKDVSVSSVRIKVLGSPSRIWMMVEEAPFGVVTLTCNGSEDEYETARKTWLDLAKGIAIPKK